MYQVYITGYRLLEVPYTKPYYVYTIELGKTNSSIVQIVEKRYSEFNTLHRMLKKDADTAPFPPKRVRNSQLKVLEQRRSALELYLQKMIRLASTKQHVLNFLGIENRTQNSGERMHGESGIGDGKQSLNRQITETETMVSLNVIQTIVFIAISAVQASTCLLRYPLALLEDSLEMSLLISPSDYNFLKNSMKLSIAFSQLYFAGYADNRLPRKLIAVSLIVSGGVMLFFGKIDNYDALVILVIISGVFQGLVWPSLCKVSFFWIQDSRLNTFFGLLSVSEYLGHMLADYCSLYLLGKYSSWKFVYPPLSSGVVLMSVVAFLTLYIPRELKIDVPGRDGCKKLSPRASWREKFSLAGVSDLSMAVLCLRLVKSAVLFWVPDFFIHKAGYSDYRTDVALAVYKASNILGCIGIGFTGRKETVLVQSLVLLGIGTLAFVLFWLTISWGFIWSVNFLALSGFAIGGPTGALSASFAVSLGELEGRKSGGAVVGIINAFGLMGEILEQTIVGFVIDTYGWNSVFILLINLLCFSAFLVNRAHFATKSLILNSRQYVVSNSAAI